MAAPCAKCSPFRVTVKGPWASSSGAKLVNTGTGLFSVAPALPSLLVSDGSTALIVIELGAGGNSGAVYKPLASIVPSVAFPPATPLTDQFTAGWDPSPVFAANCCWVAPAMAAPEGVMVNAVRPGPPAPEPGRIASAHPPSTTANAISTISAERFTLPPWLFRSLAAEARPCRQVPFEDLGTCGRTGVGRVGMSTVSHYCP